MLQSRMMNKRSAHDFDSLICDYDGTLSSDGSLSRRMVEALTRWRATGRTVVLDTGRTLPHLYGQGGIHRRRDIELFDRVVAENGAILWDPQTDRVTVLGAPPSPEVTRRLHDAGITGIVLGWASIHIPLAAAPVATRVLAGVRTDVHTVTAPEHLIVLRRGVDKVSGMRAALADMNRPRSHSIAVGDGANDLTLLNRAVSGCGLTVAVANAIRPAREVADITTGGAACDGVIELIDSVLSGDLRRAHGPMGPLASASV